MKKVNGLNIRRVVLLVFLLSLFSFITYKAYSLSANYTFVINITDCVQCYECVGHSSGLISIGPDGYPYWNGGTIENDFRYLKTADDSVISAVYMLMNDCPSGSIYLLSTSK